MPNDLLNSKYKWHTFRRLQSVTESTLRLPNANIHCEFFDIERPRVCIITIELNNNKQKIQLLRETIKTDTLMKGQIYAVEKLSEYIENMQQALKEALTSALCTRI